MPGTPRDEQFADYLAGRMTREETLEFERHMDSDDRSAVDLWERLADLPADQPSPLVKQRFQQLLKSETHSHVRWIPWAMAAAIFAGGFFAGRIVPVQPPEDVAALRQEVRTLRETVIVSMLRQESASDRLKGVLTSASLNRPDADVTAALIDTVRRDANVNVRLAAIDALRRFSGDQTVRANFAGSLSTGDSPLVQIALIDALVEMQDRSAAPALRRLGASTEVDKSVKERARFALERLEQ